MRCDLPVFDRSKCFSSYVRYKRSRFCISCDDLGDYWVSFLSEDYPSYFLGPFSQLNALKTINTTIHYFNHLEANRNEKRI